MFDNSKPDSKSSELYINPVTNVSLYKNTQKESEAPNHLFGSLLSNKDKSSLIKSMETEDPEPVTVEKSSLINIKDISLDDLVNKVGVGVWTFLYFCLATLVPMAMVTNLIISEFIATEVPFECSVPVIATESPGILITDSPGLPIEKEPPSVYISAYTVPPVNVEVVPRDECVSRSNNLSRPCENFVYNNSLFATTLTTEFDLVCERSQYRHLFQMIFTIGCLVGAPIGGIVSDKFGRQRSLWYSCLVLVILTILLVVVPVFWVVLLIRFIMGIFTDIAFLSSITLGMEISPHSCRWLFSSVESFPYAIMLPILAGVAYLTRYWRRIQLWCSFPLLLATILSSPFILDESPRWLATQGRIEEAVKVIRRAARLNKTSHCLPQNWNEELYKELKKSVEGSTKEPIVSRFWSLFSTSEMRTITLVLTVMWLVEGTLYISLPLEASSYESPFLYMTLLGLIELPGTFIITPLGAKMGRKKIGFTCGIITAVMLAIMACLRGINHEHEWVLVALGVTAYVSLVGVSQMNILLTSELFPTTVRSLGSSIGYFMNNLGYCLPPVLELVMDPTKPYIILSVYSLMALINSCLLLLLPETNMRSLSETVPEHVRRERDRKQESIRKRSSVSIP